jgi:Response regulator containing a CheY-like receiver domain and an HTH DNA-binding domain
LVDDDEVYLYVTKKILNKLSDELMVNSFTDGEQAIEFIGGCVKQKETLPDVILLDINMPFLDGWGFLAEFKKLKPQLPNEHVNIFMVTSSNDSNDLKRAQEFEELTGYVVKPVYEDKLIEILTGVFDSLRNG